MRLWTKLADTTDLSEAGKKIVRRFDRQMLTIWLFVAIFFSMLIAKYIYTH